MNLRSIPVRIKLAALAAATALTIASALPLLVGSAAVPSNVGDDEFFVVCPYAKSLPDDPIVMPGMPGMMHMHTFFGNKGTTAFSTAASLVASPSGSSSCRTQDDRSGYWSPQPYIDGKPFNPLHASIYYTNWPSGTASNVVTAPPPGAAMIAGNSKATGELPVQQVRFTCGNAHGVTAPSSTKPYDCDPGHPSSKGNFSKAAGFDGEVVSLFFPACWNGKANPSTLAGDIVYYTSTTCPSTHPKKLARISVRLHLGVFDLVDDATGRIKLTWARLDLITGVQMGDAPYYTAHADFLNGWNQVRLTNLVNSCLNAHPSSGCSSIH